MRLFKLMAVGAVGAVAVGLTGVAPAAEAAPASPVCRVYVTSSTSNNLSVIDTWTRTVSAIALDRSQTSVDLNRTGTKVFVGTSAGVRMIDANTQAVTSIGNANVQLVAASPTSDVLLVGSFISSLYYRLDSETGAAIGGNLPATDGPYRAVFSSDGSTVYATHYNNNTHEVDKINMSNFSITPLVLELNPNDFDQPAGLDVSSDGSRLFVAARLGTKVRVFDTATSTVTGTIVPAGQPWDVATVPNSSLILFTESGTNRVVAYDTANNTILATVPVGSTPFNVEISPDGRYAFVVNNGSNTVSQIDLSSYTVVETYAVGSSPREISIGPANCTTIVPPPPPPPPIIPIWRVSMDPAGGVCTDGGSAHDVEWLSVFVAYRYLPAAADCERSGYSFSGWADVAAPNEALALPLLVDPTDGVERYFVAANHSLVASWVKVKDELQDLTGTAPGAFVGGPDRRTHEGGGVVDGYYIPPGTQFGPRIPTVSR